VFANWVHKHDSAAATALISLHQAVDTPGNDNEFAVLAALGGQRILDFSDVTGYRVPPMADFWIGQQATGEGFRGHTSPSPHRTGQLCGPSSAPP
jgi:hypothetical protein